MKLNLKELAAQIHENAKAKGFYDNKDHKFFKHAQVFEIIKEVAEFHEAYKKGKDGAGDWYLENPEEVGASPVFPACIKDTWQDELADIMIRLLDYAAFVGFEFLEYDTKQKKAFIGNYGLGSQCLYLVERLGLIPREGGNYAIHQLIFELLNIATELQCNLEWHIQAKMAYNATRERLHGKKF